MDREKKIYDIPKKGENVWPQDICPAYTPRDEAVNGIKGCWYCRYADFHLKDENALEVGICNWPNKVFK